MAEQQAYSIYGSQTLVNGGAADYRFSLGVGSRWRYLGLGGDTGWRQGAGAFMLVDGRPQTRDTKAGTQARPLANPAGIQLIYNYRFQVSDGEKTYDIAVKEADQDHRTAEANSPADHILSFPGPVPPPQTDLTVVNPVIAAGKSTLHPDPRANIICFTPGTWIRTGFGQRLVEDLRPGDPVQTKDNGLQSIRWIGRRRMTGARLLAMPEMRPIRIRRGAFGEDLPSRDLWVSPKHRMVQSGPRSELLFNTPEVLVAAKDLINQRSISQDHQIRQTEYIHILFDRHQVIWANGAETESFHPGYSMLDAVGQAQLAELYQIFPELEADPHNFGQSARRSLQPHEAAVFLC